MKFIAFCFALLLPGAATFAADTTTAASHARPDPVLPKDILTNEALVTLAEAGFSDSFIVEKIRLSRSRFDTSVEGLAYLRRNWISEELVHFVMEYAARPAAQPSAAAVAVPMKIVKQNMLVPATPTGAPGVPIVATAPVARHRHSFSVHLSRRAPAVYAITGYTQPPDALPARPILQSPALPPPDLPVMPAAAKASLSAH